MRTVAIFGAAGFVGAALVEHLFAKETYEIRPYIHSTGGGWRLARYGLDLQSVDITNERQVRDAVGGCTHVVNATWGSKDVMLAGLTNLLEASLASGVKRYVHLSSVSVYGDREPGTVLRENDAPTKKTTDYGKMKSEQDRRVETAQRKGLPCIVLAPPNISGAYSPFLLRVLAAIRSRSLALIDGGNLPCSLVDVENLAGALEQALVCERDNAGRIFVTDDETPTWRALAERLAPLAEQVLPFPTVTRREAEEITSIPPKRPSLMGTLRSLASILTTPATRAILHNDPLTHHGYRLLAEALPERMKRHARALGAPNGRAPRQATPTETFDTHLLQLQLRAVRHSCENAKSVLAYRPALSFDQSMDAFLSWYRMTHGFGTDSWSALSQL